MEATGSSFLTCTLSRGSSSSWVTSTHPFPAPYRASATCIPGESPKAAAKHRDVGAQLVLVWFGVSQTGCISWTEILSAFNEGFDLHSSTRSWKICPFPSSFLNRTWHMLTGQIPGTLEGDWGVSIWKRFLLTLSEIFIYLCKAYLDRCLFSIWMIFLEKLVSMGWSSFCGKQLYFLKLESAAFTSI